MQHNLFLCAKISKVWGIFRSHGVNLVHRQPPAKSIKSTLFTLLRGFKGLVSMCLFARWREKLNLFHFTQVKETTYGRSWVFIYKGTRLVKYIASGCCEENVRLTCGCNGEKPDGQDQRLPTPVESARTPYYYACVCVCVCLHPLLPCSLPAYYQAINASHLHLFYFEMRIDSSKILRFCTSAFVCANRNRLQKFTEVL